MGGGPSETTQQAELPDELKPLFEALTGAITGLTPQAGGILGAVLQGQAQPQLSPVQSLVGNLVAQRIAGNPLLAGLGAAQGLAGGAPPVPPRAQNIPPFPFALPASPPGGGGPEQGPGAPLAPGAAPLPGTAILQPALPPGFVPRPQPGLEIGRAHV